MVFSWLFSPRTSKKRSFEAEEKQEMYDENQIPTTTGILSKLIPVQHILAKKKRTEGTSQEVLQLREPEADDASDGDDSVTSMSPQDDKGIDMQDTEEEDGIKDTVTKVACPCGCTAYSHSSAQNFRTHEKCTMQLYVFSPAITNYRGKRYSADDIAIIWKKDCRKWLWKSCKNDILE